MSETYSAMVERIMRDNFAKFALEYERKMYEPPDFLRRIQEEERQKMQSVKLDISGRVIPCDDDDQGRIGHIGHADQWEFEHSQEAEHAAQRLWERNVDRYMKSFAARLHVLECANHIETAETWSIDGNPVPREPKRPRYEYIFKKYDVRIEMPVIWERLAVLGDRGWCLCSVVVIGDENNFILRREIFP